MTKLITQNAKMKRSSNRIFNFGIPAYRSESGIITCPNAGECMKGCYARQGTYTWSNVKPAYEKRLNALMSDHFVSDMSYEIRKSKPSHIRINDGGDIFSAEILGKWIHLAQQHPDVVFYAYTKQVSLIKKYKDCLPDNFIYRFSFGGKEDHLIDVTKDRHAIVFNSKDDMPSNYIDGTHDDSHAFNKDILRLGLVYHGAKSKNWGR